MTKEMYPDYDSVTKSDDNKHVLSNLSSESEVDNDVSTLGIRQDTTEEQSTPLPVETERYEL